MKDNQFLITLSKISQKEIKGFYNYSIKHFSEDSAANKVLAYLLKHYGDYDSHHLEERLAFRKIFTGQNFVEKKIGNAISDLRTRLIEYLYWKELEQNSLEKEILILKILEKRGLDNLVKKQLKTVTNVSEKVPQDMWFWMSNLRLAHEKYYNLDLEKVAHQSLKIEEVMKRLDNFTAIAKLKYSCEIFARNDIVNESFDKIAYLDEMLLSNEKDAPILYQCYKAALFLNKNKKEENYIILKELTFKHLKELDERDKHILISYITNFFAYKIRTGHQSFGQKLFDFYKEGIEFKAFMIDGFFHTMHFNNIVDIGCRLNQHVWSEEFIEKWGNSLSEEYKNGIISFSTAFIKYEQGDYQKALTLLENEFKKSIFYVIKTRWLELICYYELDMDYDKIDKKCKAFKQFIHRNKVLHDSLKKGVLSFIKIFDSLFSSNVDKDKLLKVLEETPFILYKSWLLSKIENLK